MNSATNVTKMICQTHAGSRGGHGLSRVHSRSRPEPGEKVNDRHAERRRRDVGLQGIHHRRLVNQDGEECAVQRRPGAKAPDPRLAGVGRGRWPQAVVLAVGASCVRITGLFLALALMVEFCVRRESPRRAGWLMLPLAPLVGYSVYQHGRSGDWMAWKHAQEAGWGRGFAWPWEAWETSWREAMGDGDFSVAFRMEIAGAVVAVGALVWLLVLRRWSEAVYVGAQAAALLTSAYYLSVPRSLLLCFPLWVLVAKLATRKAWVIAIYALILGPLMLLHTALFLNGAWAG